MTTDLVSNMVVGGVKTTTTRQEELDRQMARLMEDATELDAGKKNISLISSDPNQPRKRFINLDELAVSLKEHGQIQPIVVREDPKQKGRYIIVVGERRWRAAQLTNWSDIEVVVKEFSQDDLQKIAKMQIAENKDRESLTPLEEAHWYKHYTDTYFSGKQKKAAVDLGVSEAFISNRISILSADDSVKFFADTFITKDVDTIISLSRLQKSNPDEAGNWMKQASSNGIVGSLRQDVQRVLKQVKSKTPAKAKKPSVPKVKVMMDRVARVGLFDNQITLTVSYDGHDEYQIPVGKREARRLLKDLEKALEG